MRGSLGRSGARRTAPLARPPSMARGCSLHPPARRSMEREHRQRVLRRDAVPSLHVGLCRRCAPTGSRIPTRAAIPCLSRLSSGRKLLARMGNRASLRAKMSAVRVLFESGRRSASRVGQATAGQTRATRLSETTRLPASPPGSERDTRQPQRTRRPITGWQPIHTLYTTLLHPVVSRPPRNRGKAAPYMGRPRL